MRRLAGLAVALSLAACAPQTATLPGAPVAAGPIIRVVAEQVGEDDPGHEGVCVNNFPGRFVLRCEVWRFAGALKLTSPDTSRFHGLSDLDVQPDGRLVAVTDEGDLVKGRIVLDPAGRLTGLAGVSLAPLTNPEGQPLSGAKSDSDAEGLALRANGDLMVSFERNHRIWLYPAAGGPPHAVPSPAAPFPENDGMEALAADPAAGPDAYLTGREDTRETWTCRLSGGCTPSFRVDGDARGSLVAARALPGGRWAFLLRHFSPASGVTIWIVIADRTGRTLDSHEIKRPATVDNFEGLAALPRPDGTVRFYLVSDDNVSSLQRTLLLAFDWRPPPTSPIGGATAEGGSPAAARRR